MVSEEASHGAKIACGAGVIQLVTPFVDERLDGDTNAEEHGEMNQLTISYSCRTEHRYKSEYDEECCTLGFLH
jgi:hypothetical protein